MTSPSRLRRSSSWYITAGAAALGTLLAGAAALAPALWLRRFPVVPVLAGE